MNLHARLLEYALYCREEQNELSGVDCSVSARYQVSFFARCSIRNGKYTRLVPIVISTMLGADEGGVVPATSCLIPKVGLLLGVKEELYKVTCFEFGIKLDGYWIGYASVDGYICS